MAQELCSGSLNCLFAKTRRFLSGSGQCFRIFWKMNGCRASHALLITAWIDCGARTSTFEFITYGTRHLPHLLNRPPNPPHIYMRMINHLYRNQRDAKTANSNRSDSLMAEESAKHADVYFQTVGNDNEKKAEAIEDLDY